jgi:hypothetical protein
VSPLFVAVDGEANPGRITGQIGTVDRHPCTFGVLLRLTRMADMHVGLPLAFLLDTQRFVEWLAAAFAGDVLLGLPCERGDTVLVEPQRLTGRLDPA